MGTFTMRMDDEFKKEFSSVCQELGCNMSTVITMVGKKMIRERRIPFEVSADPFYLPANQAHIDRSIKQLEAMHGKVHELIEDEQ